LEGKKACGGPWYFYFQFCVGISIALWAQTIYELSLVAWTMLLLACLRRLHWHVLEESQFLGCQRCVHGGFVVWILATTFSSTPGLGVNPQPGV
jgi:hypothetical protein